MDKNLPGPMTPFDDLVTSPELQIMKLLIPYAPASGRKMLAACVKIMELRETLHIFSGKKGAVRAQMLTEEENPSPIDLLNSFRPYLKPREAAALDMVINLRNDGCHGNDAEYILLRARSAGSGSDGSPVGNAFP